MDLKSPVTQDDLDDKKCIYAYILDDEPTTVKLDINGYDDVDIFGASSAPLAEELRDYLNIFFSAIQTLIAAGSKEKEFRGIRSGRIADGANDEGEPAITVMLPSEQADTDGNREPGTVQGRLACCPLCGGEIRATVERYYSLRGGVWVESGVDGDTRLLLRE